VGALDTARQNLKIFRTCFGLVVENSLGELLNLARQHCSPIKFHHEQCAHDLMQVRDTEAQPGLVPGILAERLERETRLLEGLVDLVLDPAKRGRIDFGLSAHGRNNLGSRRRA